MVTDISHDETELGNYFIANYPPFSYWKKDQVGKIRDVLAQPPIEGVPLGLYLHIPFCRKRCKFCYFRVYTDVNSSVIQQYVDGLSQEVGMLFEQPALKNRTPEFVYFGGGTPSYLSAKQLRDLTSRLRTSCDWENAREVTFECEPGTISQSKLDALKELGVTRLSLGVENFSDAILEENGRAHLSEEIFRAWGWLRNTGFDQVNIDLISGMVGETWDNWRTCIEKTIELEPESVTIYQMELPFNTRYANQLDIIGQDSFATWSQKRDWVLFASEELQKAGYSVSSAYTFVRDKQKTSFVYRDSLWRGADLVGAGVASFGHLSHIHYQNWDKLEDYHARLEKGELPLGRALEVTDQERQIREMILQMKLGWLDAGYFRDKFGVEIYERYQQEFGDLVQRGYASIEGDRLQLSPQGLMRVDAMLPRFFLPEHRSTDRYT